MKTLLSERTINRTIRTSLLIDQFWERWLVHGVDADDLSKVRPELISAEHWIDRWHSLAKEKKKHADFVKSEGLIAEAEYMYRLTGLYYNLVYWLFPTRTPEKEKWYKKCLEMFRIADCISPVQTQYEWIEVDRHKCAGRIRIPDHSRGIMIIVNPIDSSKEELFTYESDFLKAGFTTVSFDGPGQGESYVLHGLQGTKKRWEEFMGQLIDFASDLFPNKPIYLFGTSLGASWALYGSCFAKIKKTVAVSPAVEFEKLNLPGYFLGRMECSCTLAPGHTPIPDFRELSYRSPTVVFHGKKDQMVTSADMYELFNLLPAEKKLVEYEEEGHCCNNKLDEIRQIAMQWVEAENEWEGG
ncbi:alpha/beta hydrolase [Brevibacillus sp. GCM10020057]|uniref:alpha/beta hydrolase n=1 Tax=Brevibacillus sp. GCM10020057 TaxID=3317327 RepID=UPI00362B75CC